MMRKLFFLPAIVLIIWACSSSRGIVNDEKDLAAIESDSLVFDFETFDKTFYAWYEYQSSLSKAKSLKYYEKWNRQYISAWNENAKSMGQNSFFDPIVGFNQSKKYGFEFNHKLFYYFQYIEHVLRIPIMPKGPKSILL